MATSAKEAVEAAIYEALSSSVTVARVYQDVPEDAPYPLVIIGDMSSARLPGKEPSRDRIVTVHIITLVEASERAPLLALLAQVDAALDGETLHQPGWTIVGAFENDDAVLGDDGDYSGVSIFSFVALEG
ncbi:tail completion protein gp17 [Sphingomonas endophytica]|uniref:Gene transfer agent protein n=1 Tax=Sphingomonas endophytica TaxID=869719 RepID=A0A147I3E6_9SPHN|nr:DUF3168 domain-containing protein [Sphingomonas endophytica]KTT72620.1 hypothetical protein NS334_08475 [Sphingomonas endophytica]